MALQLLCRAAAHTKKALYPPYVAYCFLGCFLLAAPLVAEEPWFLDRPPRPPHPRSISPLVSLSERLIGFHKGVISPADGPRSHFAPSSSLYTLESIQVHGFFKGFLRGCDRLMRENDELWLYPITEGPHGTLKWDPVR